MRAFICCGITFLYCAILRITMGISPLFILCMFLSLVLNTLLFLFPERGHRCICLLWVLTIWIQPEFLWFLPTLFLHIALQLMKHTAQRSEQMKDILILLAACTPILYHHSLFTLHTALPFVFSILWSMFLAWLTISYERLHYQFIHSIDEHTEQQILLKEKHQALLAKQDAEVHAATLKERNRIAREIHDNVGHLLSRSLLMTGAIQTMNQSSELQVPLQQLDASLNQAMDSIRDSVHNLHDESLNLEESIRQLAGDFQFCPITLTYDMGYEPPTTVRYAFLSIAKEALVNITKHSNATRVRLTMREHPSLYQLEIADNGTKTPPSCTASRGIGLINIQERVTQLNGTLTLYTDQGFRIFITIPKT